MFSYALRKVHLYIPRKSRHQSFAVVGNFLYEEKPVKLLSSGLKCLSSPLSIADSPKLQLPLQFLPVNETKDHMQSRRQLHACL